jgi:hypothetical protein
MGRTFTARIDYNLKSGVLVLSHKHIRIASHLLLQHMLIFEAKLHPYCLLSHIIFFFFGRDTSYVPVKKQVHHYEVQNRNPVQP